MRKIVSQYNGSNWVVLSDKRFVHDGWNLIEEQEISPASSRFYVWGLDLSQSLQGAGGIGGLLATVSGSTTDHFLYDGNGNVGQLINAVGGSLDAQYEYDPYGNMISSTGTLSASNPFRFSTKYLDTETGLYYYGYRYYDPKDGRWLSRDPIEELGFETINFTIADSQQILSLNSYAFVVNNSLNMVDLFGLVANWHHLLPQSPGLMEKFTRQGLNIDSPEFGIIMEADFHTGKGGLHPNWNKDWAMFFNTKPNATKVEILNHLNKMKKDPHYAQLIAKGVPAKVSYNEWRRLAAKARHEAFDLWLKTASKKSGKKIIKAVPLISVIFIIEDIHHKGVAGGIANNVLDQIPWIGWAKMSECATGDWIPDIR